MGIIFQNGFFTQANGASFTLTSDMFDANAGYGSVCGTQEGEFLSNFSGITVANSNGAYCGVYATLSGYTEINLAFTSAGIGVDGSGFMCNVTWGSGSTIQSGVVKVMYRIDNHNIRICPIDATDVDYLINNNDSNDSTALVGTFNFPATFTLLIPLVDKGGWC
jgi:hypothetical protein